MAIERIRYTNLDNLKPYIEKGIPVVIEGITNTTGPLSWTPELLAEIAGNVSVDVLFSEDGVFSKLGKKKTLLLGDYLDNHLGDHRYYLQQICLSQELPELLPSLVEMSIGSSPIDVDMVSSANLWVSSQTSSTRLHYDTLSNLFFQCYGQKKLVLFDPSQSEYLYPQTEVSMQNVSSVDCRKPDLTLFPNFSKAHSDIVTLKAGEAIFLPSYYWHHVTGLSTSISVNFWCKPFDFQATSVLRDLHLNYEMVAEQISALQPFYKENPLNIAKQFSAKGLYYESCICHIALLEREVNIFVRDRPSYGNLEQSIKLLKPNGIQKYIPYFKSAIDEDIDPAIREKIIEILKFGIELLNSGELKCDTAQAIATCTSAEKCILYLRWRSIEQT